MVEDEVGNVFVRRKVVAVVDCYVVLRKKKTDDSGDSDKEDIGVEGREEEGVWKEELGREGQLPEWDWLPLPKEGRNKPPLRIKVSRQQCIQSTSISG